MTAIEQQTGVDMLTARLLAGRGVAPESVTAFLNPKLRDNLPDPSILQDMDKAVGLILDAVEAKQKITVFADYDVDGGTSAAQLIRWGRAMGAKFGLYVPDRVKEGYGPSDVAFQQLKEEGNDLVITVDCGAAAHGPLEAAHVMNLPVVVIDHHLMEGDMPPAQAIVNPNRPDDASGLGHLAAAGVTFMTLVALNREARRRGFDHTPDIMELLGFTALGTICDVVSLTGVNRAFVAQGLKVLSQRRHPGIEALSDVAGAQRDLTTYHAGFVLGPRINAGGRIGRADMGAELLATDDAQMAYAHAAALDRVNTERKALQAQILEEALGAAIKRADDPVLVVDMEGWHPGIIGIVAGRLKDHFGKPAIVIGVDDEAGLGKGSGRSLKGVNLGAAIVGAKEAGLLLSGGGHAMAGGLSVAADKIEALRDYLNESLSADVTQARKNLGLSIDAWMSLRAASFDLLDRINRVGPYGMGNPQPLFGFADVRVAYAQRLRGGHVRCSFEDPSGGRLNGICFRADEMGLSEVLLQAAAPRIDIVGRLREDSWQGRRKVDFTLEDIRLAE